MRTKTLLLPILLSATLAVSTAGAEGLAGSSQVPLAGTYGLGLGSAFTTSLTDDVKAFYPSGTLSLPGSAILASYFLSLRYHPTDLFYLGFALEYLPKRYTVQGTGGSRENYSFDALFPYALVGLCFHRGHNSYLFAQLDLGQVFLSQGSYSSSAGTSGRFTGTSTGSAVSLGGSWFLTRRLSITLEAGTRAAMIRPVDFYVDGQKVPPAFASEFFVDHSGAFMRLGIDLRLGGHKGFTLGLPSPSAP